MSRPRESPTLDQLIGRYYQLLDDNAELKTRIALLEKNLSDALQRVADLEK